jgi:hypothetical protein
VDRIGAGRPFLVSRRVGTLGRRQVQAAVLDHAEHLADRQRARRGRRHAAQPPHFVVETQRLAQHGAVAGEVGRRQAAGVARMGLHLGCDGLGEWAFVKRTVATLREGTQHGREFGVTQPASCRLRRAIRREEVRRGLRVLTQRLGQAFAQQRRQAQADRKALLGQPDRRLEQPAPRQLAVQAMRQRQGAQRPRRAHRAPADDCLDERQFLAVAKKQLRSCRRRRGFAAVDGVHLVAVVVHQEQAAAEARRLRLDQRQHHLYRNRRVDGAAASREDLVARVGGERVRRGHHEAACRDPRLGGVAARGLGWCRRARLARGVESFSYLLLLPLGEGWGEGWRWRKILSL